VAHMPTLTHQVYLWFIDHQDPRLTCTQLRGLPNLIYCRCTNKAAFCLFSEAALLSDLYSTFAKKLKVTFKIDATLSFEPTLNVLYRKLHSTGRNVRCYVLQDTNTVTRYRYQS
jgi:hypothetical protein